MANFPLPLLSGLILPPTMDAMRKQLGGRTGALRFAGAGELVRLKTSGKHGVVLTSDDTGAYVWIGPTEARRVVRDELTPAANRTPELRAMAAVVLRFACLLEGDAVRFKQGDVEDGGQLVEKCRYGALVMREDRTVVAVGFAALHGVSGD